MKEYLWPGNVRELQHSIERAVILTDSDILQKEDFMLSAASGTSDEIDLNSYNLEEIEKQIIQKVLKRHTGNVTQAASDLGLTRTSLYRRMEKHGL